MLVLSRRQGETIIIGEGENRVTVTVASAGLNGQVRLAIEAPSHISVDREEVRVRKDKERAA